MLSGATWQAEDWSALGSMILAVAAVLGGGWALWNYRAQRRAAAATWIHDLFRDFYVDDRYRDVKWRLVRPEYLRLIAPLLERRLANRDVALTSEEDQLLRDLDTLLNFFEHIMYLESQGHLHATDRKALFNYWLDLLKHPEYAALRRYVARFDYEQLASVVEADDTDYLALYGTLRSDVEQPGVTPILTSSTVAECGPCVVPGRLIDLGRYPGLVSGESEVAGELLEVKDPAVFRRLDPFEDYDPARPKESKFHRRLIRLVDPPVDAWVYVYVRDATGCPAVVAGDWKLHVERRQHSAFH